MNVGRGQAASVERLLRLLEELAWFVDDPSPVRDQVERLRTTIARSDFDDAELLHLERAATRVERAISLHAARRMK